jgi:hypothetical protein
VFKLQKHIYVLLRTKKQDVATILGCSYKCCFIVVNVLRVATKVGLTCCKSILSFVVDFARINGLFYSWDLLHTNLFFCIGISNILLFFLQF